MEISNENIFKMRYTSILGDKVSKNKKRTSRKIRDFILNNKIVSIAIVVFLTCVGINLVLIYNFMRILSNI